jgi:hypothetical protein
VENCPTGCTCNWSVPRPNERMLEMIRLLHHSARYIDQTDGRGAISGQQHALRCAGLGAEQGKHPDSAFIGLVHDLARPLNDVHHGEIIAEMVRDRVSEDTYQILRTHGAYQAAIVHKHSFPEEPWSDAAKQLAGFELRSFSSTYTGPQMSIPQAIKLMDSYLG